MAIDGTKKMLDAEAMQEEMERRKQSTEQDAIESVNEESTEGRVRVGRPRGSLAFTSRKNLGPEDYSKPVPDQSLLNETSSSTAPPEIPSLKPKLSKNSSSRGPNPFIEGSRPSLVKRASSALASPRMMIKSASSALVQIQEGTKEVLSALRPGLDGVALGIDVLGIDMPERSNVPPPPRLQETMSSHFEDEELFEVDVSGENAETLIAGEGLTSAVLREGVGDDGKPTLDWAEELLLLSHEPLRRDMLEMQRALQVGYFGNLPESWRVRAFFRFFNCWCMLVSQQQAVEVAVHYDWLVQPTHKLPDEARKEVLAYHRKVELEMHSISRLENKILAEIASVDTLGEPWSEAAQELRERVGALCSEIRAHLAAQERLLPGVLRDYWGRISPPQLVDRSLKAAKGAVAKGAKSAKSDRPLFLMWVLHYLRRRNPQRARYFHGQLPRMTRLKIAMRNQKHTTFLSYLRYIVHDEQPAAAIVGNPAPPQPVDPSDPFAARKPDGRGGDQHERQRRAGMVNAMLAAANAERIDVPTSGAGPTRSLAESQTPAHVYSDGGNWANKHTRVPSDLFKKIGVDQPSTPRRL